MSQIRTLLQDYQIESADVERIRRVAPMLLARKEQFGDFHYGVLLKDPETAKFFRDEKVLTRARAAFVGWYESLLAGEYDHAWYLKLSRIGGVHVKIGLPAYHVNVQMSHIRSFLADAVRHDLDEEPVEADRTIGSLNKLLDLNLDLMTRSYREEELKVHFLSYRLDSGVLTLARWFVTGLNMALVGGLMTIGLLVLGLLVGDFTHLIASETFERGVLGALGSVLMLWVIIELLDTQIRHMKGSAFAIKVFVSVALVAELRHVLILSIEKASWVDEAVLAATIMVLGVVYWLVSRLEQ